MEEYKEKCARMSNHSFIQELDQAAAILDDELKAISEVENANNTSVYHAEEDVLFQDDDDDLTGELANLESLASLQQELNMSALSFEEFNPNNISKASIAMNQSIEEEDAVITDVGEIQIGDAIMLEDEWKPTPSLSQDSSIRSESVIHRVHHHTSSTDGRVNPITTQPSNDSEDSSVFQTTSSHDGAMHLLSQDRLDFALSPIRFHQSELLEEGDKRKYEPSQESSSSSSTRTPAREIFVDTTKSSVNINDSQQESEDATPKIQNTRPGLVSAFQFQDDANNSGYSQVGKPTPKKEEEEENAGTPTIDRPKAPEPSPMSLLNTLLSSPEPFFVSENLARTVSEEEAPDVQAVATSDSETSNDAGEMHSFSSQASSEPPSVLSTSSISATSATSSQASSTSKSSTQSTDSSKKKWIPTRLFKQKNNDTSEESQRKSIFSKSTSKKKKSKSKIRLRSSPAPVVLPTVSEDTTLPPAQTDTPTPTNITVSPPHDPTENQIRETLGMEQDGGKRDSLFKDNKERVAVNRMMKMLMEQRKKNKTQERRERKLLHMLCDARNDRMQLIDEHKQEFQDLERKMRSSFENSEILRQENELLLMQTEAWKEISRQSNQTAALYKYTFDERQGGQPSSWYQAPVGETMDGRIEQVTGAQDSMKEEHERKLAQAYKEYEELEEKLKQFQKDSHLELEDAKYQATWIKRELEQSESMFEAKLETYIQENVQLKEETVSLRKELEQSQAQLTTARTDVQDLKKKLDSRRPNMHSEITNLRVQKLEDQIVQLQDHHQTNLSNSNLDITILQVRIKDLETSLGESNALRHDVEEELKGLQDQLSRERRSRGTSIRIFQQQNESLMRENRSLQESVEELKTKLDNTRIDQEKIEAQLAKERKEVHRLEKQAESEAELVKDLQDELDSLQAKLDDAGENQAAPAAAPTLETARSPQVERDEAQGTLEQEILAAENVALRAQVGRLKIESRSKPFSSPTPTSYPSTYKSPVEKRVRDQMLRLRSSLTNSKQDENSVAPLASPFFSDSPSVTLTGNLKGNSKAQKSSTPKTFASMLRPKANKGLSIQPRRLDKENNATFLSPQRRRGVGLSTRTGLGIR